MAGLRHLMAARRTGLLAFVLAALGMNALVPAGVMLAPAPADLAQIILCPQTHPLARAAAAATRAPDLAALHAAMGHGAADHGAAIDHAAMGHAVMGDAVISGPDAGHDDDAPQTAAANPQSCAFAGLSLAALLPEGGEFAAPPLALAIAPPAGLASFTFNPPAHLRPPLRAPPALI